MPYTPSSIVSVPTGDFTPGALAALQNSVAMINASWNLAKEAAYTYDEKMAAISDPTTGWLNPTSAPKISGIGTVASPTVSEPTITIPTEISTANILSDFTAQETALINQMKDLWAAFNTAHYPADDTNYEKVVSWIQGAIDNPNGGLPTAVAAQLLTDETDKITLEAARATDSVVSGFAARGFPLPPGMAASAAVQIQQTAQDKKAEAGRKLTAISVDMMKFAVTTALNMRQMAMAATLDYVKTLVLGPDIASKVIGIGYDAQTKLINAVSGLVGARTEVQKLVSSVSEFNVTTGLQVAEKNQMSDLTVLEARVKTILAQCQALAQELASGLNNLHASAGTSYGVNGT